VLVVNLSRCNIVTNNGKGKRSRIAVNEHLYSPKKATIQTENRLYTQR